LIASGILANLDVYILANCCIAIDRMQDIETLINKNIKFIRNKEIMSAKDKYTKDFFRCCNELSLSPQSRAKFGSLALQAKDEKEDELLNILRDDDD
jgi:P27 family predicted phage terminase small subunit